MGLVSISMWCPVCLALSDVCLEILSRISCYCIDLVLGFLFHGFRFCLYHVAMLSLLPMSACWSQLFSCVHHWFPCSSSFDNFEVSFAHSWIGLFVCLLACLLSSSVRTPLVFSWGLHLICRVLLMLWLF